MLRVNDSLSDRDRLIQSERGESDHHIDNG